MYSKPENHIFEYTNQTGDKITMEINWDADMTKFIEVFYIILRHSSFTHKTALQAFHKDYKDTLS